ncbi:hypothetical protein ACFSUK_00540 [Sphingobium scionense]
MAEVVDAEVLVDRDKPVDEPSTPSFLERRGIAFDEIARTVKRPTIRLKPSECSIWPGNARDHAALSHERCASLIDSIREEERTASRLWCGGRRTPRLLRVDRRHPPAFLGFLAECQQP